MISSDTSAARPASRRARVSGAILALGMTVAPVLWLAQMLLSYAISADVCIGLHWATAVFPGQTLRNALFTCDAIAASGAIAGALLSYRNWRFAGAANRGETGDITTLGNEVTRFLAVWGMLASTWFFSAIVFNTIASIMVAPCMP